MTPQKAAVSTVHKLPIRSLTFMVLVLILAVLVAPHLKAQATVTYHVGTYPVSVVFDGANIWVANAGSNNVTKLLASTGVTIGSYPVTNPIGIAFDGVRIWVTSGSSGTVTKLLASTGALVGTYPAGSSPAGIVFDGANIWVANYVCPTCGAINTVTKLLAATGSIVGTYPVGANPIGLAFDGTNIWVENEGSSTVTKLTASTGATVGTYPVGANPEGVTFDGANIWVTNEGSNNVTKLLASTGALVGTYPVGANPLGVAFDGTSIWVANAGSNNVTKLLASTGGLVGTYPVGTHPDAVAFDGADNIWVATFYDNSVTKISAASLTTVTLSVTNLVFGNQVVALPSALQNVTATNSGTATINIAGIAITGTNSADYAQTNTCGGSLAAGTSCRIFVTFTPTSTGARTASIFITDNANNSPQTISLMGTGQLNSQAITFGPLSNLTNPAPPFALNATASSRLPVSFATTTPAVCTLSGATVTIIGGGTCSITASQAGNATYSAAPSVTQSFTVTGPGPQAPSISPGGIVPLDSTVSTIQPGEWVSIYGSNLAMGTTVWGGSFPISLGGTSVKINDKTAYLSLVSPGQINLQAPDDTTHGPVPVVVTSPNGSATSTVTLGQFGPSFALLDTKHVAGIILRSEGSGAYGGGTYDILGPTGRSLGYATVAAKAGNTVELFGVGFGPTTPPVPAGQVFSGAAATTNTVQLSIGGATVTPSFAGLSSAGLYQINLTLPAGLGTGDVPLTATVGGVQTQSGVVISLVGAQPIGFTGYWTFAAQSSVYGFQSGASGQVTQNGNTISGQLSLSGTPCAGSAAASGTFSGNSLSMTLNENGQLVTFSGTISSDGNSASGSYVAPPGGCTNGDHGTWSGVKD
jgi:uncharacterized protein (TIGR03437 family)